MAPALADRITAKQLAKDKGKSERTWRAYLAELEKTHPEAVGRTGKSGRGQLYTTAAALARVDPKQLEHRTVEEKRMQRLEDTHKVFDSRQRNMAAGGRAYRAKTDERVAELEAALVRLQAAIDDARAEQEKARAFREKAHEWFSRIPESILRPESGLGRILIPEGTKIVTVVYGEDEHVGGPLTPPTPTEADGDGRQPPTP